MVPKVLVVHFLFFYSMPFGITLAGEGCSLSSNVRASGRKSVAGKRCVVVKSDSLTSAGWIIPTAGKLIATMHIGRRLVRLGLWGYMLRNLYIKELLAANAE
jgi:hypothetical protein